MSELVKREETDLPCALVALATNSLLPSAALYRYLVDWHVQHWTPSEAAQDERYSEYEALPKELCTLLCANLPYARGPPASQSSHLAHAATVLVRTMSTQITRSGSRVSLCMLTNYESLLITSE